MSDKDIEKMVKILMEISKERYFKFKKEILTEKEFTQESIHFLSLLFAHIEKHRSELQEGGAGV